MKTVIPWVLLFLAGIFVGRRTVDVPIASEPEDNAATHQALKDKITALEKEVEGYRRPKPTPSQMPKREEAAAAPSPSPSGDAATEAPTPKKQWLEWEKRQRTVNSPGELSTFLEKVRITDFNSEIGNAKVVSKADETIELLNGAFTGTKWKQDGVVDFTIAMEANLRIQNQTPRGRLNIRLTRDGKTFSRGSNSGEIGNIQRLGGNSTAIVLSTGEYHFQLYYFPATDSFEGNCYRQTRPGKVEYEGTIHLERL